MLWRVDDGWRVLGDRIVAERSRRWRSRPEFARASGVSVRVLDDLERGIRGNYLPSTLAAVEVALGWAPGSCLRIVQGGRERKLDDPLLARIVELWPRLSRESHAMLVELAERAHGAR